MSGEHERPPATNEFAVDPPGAGKGRHDPAASANPANEFAVDPPGAGKARHGPGTPQDIHVRGLTAGYADRRVLERLDCTIPGGRVTAIVGANACGKSTLLRAVAQLIPSQGEVALGDTVLTGLSSRETARRIGFLPQSPTPPEGLTVEELVSRGRFPHLRFGRRPTAHDRERVAWALAATATDGLAARPLEALSGGQRQRVWIAMALAQDTAVLLLDEPTTYLDLAHQLDVLDLLRELNADDGRTVVMVLHDINQACRYADHLIAMKDGAVVAAGPPAEIVDAALVATVLDVRARIVPDPVTGTPMLVPEAHRSRSPRACDGAQRHSSAVRPPEAGKPQTAHQRRRRPSDGRTDPMTKHQTRTAEEIAEAMQRRAVKFPLVAGIVEVVSVERITPKMVRIGFAGPALDQMPNDEPGEIVTFIWPAEGREVVLPIEGKWKFPPEAEGQHWRNYSVRHFRRDVPGLGAVLEVDFVLHGDHGRATAWAGRAALGQRLGIAGPRMHWVTDPDAEWSLLVGDETALPAIAATLESLPEGHRALAVVEIDGPAEQQPIDVVCDAQVVWVSRDGAPAGTGNRLVDAVRAAELPSGRAKVWAAGESMAIRDVREHLRDERGLPPETLHAIGYWRHRETPDDVA